MSKFSLEFGPQPPAWTLPPRLPTDAPHARLWLEMNSDGSATMHDWEGYLFQASHVVYTPASLSPISQPTLNIYALKELKHTIHGSAADAMWGFLQYRYHWSPAV
jgi:hypothetical protein